VIKISSAAKCPKGKSLTLDSGSGKSVTISNTGLPLRVELKWNNQYFAIYNEIYVENWKDFESRMERELIVISGRNIS
jgi:hypothetical protein